MTSVSPTHPSPLGAGIAPLPVDANGRLIDDLPCRSCGYSLRGADPMRVCPECEAPVAASIRGDFLRFADPEWVAQLAKGMSWLIWSKVTLVAMMILGSMVIRSVWGFGTPKGSSAMTLAVQIVTIGALIGYWKLSAMDPAAAGDDNQHVGGHLVRWGPVAGWATGWLAMVIDATVNTTTTSGWAVQIVLILLSQAIGLAVWIALTSYMRRLAQRIPDHGLADRTRFVFWGYFISFASMTLGGLGVAVITRSSVGPPNGLVMLLFLVLGCLTVVGAIGFVVFAIWTLVLGCRYARAFSDQAYYARAFRTQLLATASSA